MLVAAQNSQDTLLNEYLSAFTAFEENLAGIKHRENILTEAYDEETDMEPGASMLRDLSQINDLLAQNQSIINSLNGRLNRAEGDQVQLRRLINRMETQLAEKVQEVDRLREELSQLEFTTESLNRRLDTIEYERAQLVHLTSDQEVRLTDQEQLIVRQQDMIGSQVEEINKAFYAVGTAKDLKNQRIITSEGGFIGIGRNQILHPDAHEDVFSRIDITELRTIAFDNKKVRLVTPHPSEAYKLTEVDNKITSLEITNPERFWAASKYLVVVTD